MTTYVVKPFDPWKSPLCTCPPKYSYSPYTGCGHGCRYCYASSYIRNFFSPRPKREVVKLLSRDLRKIDLSLPITIANSSDPYQPLERELMLTRKSLEVLKRFGAKVQIVTKSSLFVRDLDLLANMNAAVSVTVTTLDESLARKIEPGAPSPKERIEAIRKATEAGVPVSARVDPIIPYLNDDFEELKQLIEELAAAGVKHVTSSTYKVRPDNFRRMVEAFPELENKWRRLYFDEGEKLGGYRYLPLKIRKHVLEKVKELVESRGMTFAVCREGFRNLNSAVCDGTHLIPARVVYAQFKR